jgi:putative tricarboxylic transport membrane protein
MRLHIDNKKNFYTALALLLFTTVGLVEASKLPFGRLRAPKSGFFSLILTIILGILSLVLLGQAFGKRGEGEERIEEGISINWRKIGLVTGALLAYGLSFEYLGYLLCSFLFILFLLRSIEPQKWWVVIVVAFLVSLSSYLVFGILLKATLPAGILGI